MNQLLNQTLSQGYDTVPRILGTAVVLVVGLIVAAVIHSMVRLLRGRLRLDLDEAAPPMGPVRATGRLPDTISRLVYYCLLLFVLVGVFEFLRQELRGVPIRAMLNTTAAVMPNVVHALLILGNTWEVVVLAFGVGVAGGAVCLGLVLAFGRGPRGVAGEYARQSLTAGPK